MTTSRPSELSTSKLKESDVLALLLLLLPLIDHDPDRNAVANPAKYHQAIIEQFLTDRLWWDLHDPPDIDTFDAAIDVLQGKNLDKLIHSLSGKIAGQHHSPKHNKGPK